MSSSAQESFFGLGFSHTYQSINANANAENGGNAAVPDTTISSSSSAVNNMEKLMQSYMQQCLSYHDQQLEQEQQRQQQQQQQYQQQGEHPNYFQAEQVSLIVSSSSDTTPPVFIPASQSNETQIKEEEYQQKLQNARLIAQKLASRPKAISNSLTQLNPNPTNSTSKMEDHYPYAQKRNDFLKNTHSNKLQSHLLKNLDYILKKDEEVHIIQLQHLHQQQQLQTKMNQHHQHQAKHKKRVGVFQSVMGGIGTQERKKHQKSIDKTHHSVLQKKKKICGLYISGIQHETHPRRQQQQQKMMKEMFEMYGKIQTCTFYIDKKTNRYKGDGLLVYNWDDAVKNKDREGKEEGGHKNHNAKVDEFLNMVCSQVRRNHIHCWVLYFLISFFLYLSCVWFQSIVFVLFAVGSNMFLFLIEIVHKKKYECCSYFGSREYQYSY